MTAAPSLKLWWEPRETSQAADAGNLSRFVNGLPAFDSIYESWLDSADSRKNVLPVPLSESIANQLLIDAIARDDLGGALPWLGSQIGAGHAGPPPYDFRESHIAGTQCNIGGFRRSASINQNFIFMRLSAMRSSTGRSWRASELRPLMNLARDIWKPAQMCALFSFGSRFLPEIPDPTWAAGNRPLRPWVGWITYLPPDLAARAKYPQAVHVETLDDGAALVTLCDEPFDKDDTEGMARLHALEAALRPIQT